MRSKRNGRPKLADTSAGRAIKELISRRLTRNCENPLELLAAEFVEIQPAMAKPRNGVSQKLEAKRKGDGWRRFAGLECCHWMVRELRCRKDRRVRMPASNPAFESGTTYITEEA